MGDAPAPAAKQPKKKPTAGSKSRPRDIWSQILEVNKQEKRKAGDGKIDTNVLVVGSKGSGKSTLVSRFLKPDDQETPKDTMGLDYVFARRTSTGAQEKQVAHIWELGGGEDQANLMDAVITPENLRNFVCIICVDLSQPSSVLDALVFWMDRVRTRVDNCLRVMSDKKSTVPDRLRERAIAAFGAEHHDRDLVNLCSVPIVVMATKFEAFQNEEAEYRKIMARTLRFLAHVNGASLYYTSCKEKALLNQTRSVLSNFFFGGQRTGAAARHVVDHSKALAVRAGTDQISGIGAPPRVDTQGAEPVTPLDLYKHAFVSFFPPQAEKTESQQAEEDLTKFAEPAVDAMQQEKFQLLQRYRAEAADSGKR